jgi:hypothetical protein
MVRGSLILSFSFLFLWFCRFSCHLLVLWFFLLLDDSLEFFFGFWSSSYASWGLDSRFKLCAFCCQCTYQGGDSETKLSVPWFDCDESLTCHGLNSNLGYFGSFTILYVHVENRVCLSHGV